MGYRVKMVKTEFDTQAVDTEDDLIRVAKFDEIRSINGFILKYDVTIHN